MSSHLRSLRAYLKIGPTVRIKVDLLFSRGSKKYVKIMKLVLFNILFLTYCPLKKLIADKFDKYLVTIFLCLINSTLCNLPTITFLQWVDHALRDLSLLVNPFRTLRLVINTTTH